jgi:hypothetical protein
MRSNILCAIRNMALLAGMAFALPVTCSQPGDGIYSGGIQPSPAGRVNPTEPGFTNDGGHTR